VTTDRLALARAERARINAELDRLIGEYDQLLRADVAAEQYAQDSVVLSAPKLPEEEP
jgi:hypothetical protein